MRPPTTRATTTTLDAPGEHEAWAEHQAALDATLFGAAPAIELELCDGELRARSRA